MGLFSGGGVNIQGQFLTRQGGGFFGNLQASGIAQERLIGGASRELAAGYERAGAWYHGDTLSGNRLRQLMEDPSFLEEMPGYQWRLQQGQRAIEGGAAARGGLFSGRTLEELVTFGQGLASQEYASEWERMMGYAGAMSGIEIGMGEARAEEYLGMSAWLAGHEQKGREIAGSWGMADTWMGSGMGMGG